ncbi:MAG: alternative ribosome rescue aminoacyl-tRNA hydrolase ArfB [Bacteroidota bacterium]
MAGVLEKIKQLPDEVEFSATRSGGKGGQNVNKVSTKVELRFDVNNSAILSETQKKKILVKLGNRISSDGILIMTADDTRSQFKNKEIVTRRFLEEITLALRKEKKRIPTRKSKASVEETLKKKKIKSEKKKRRKGIDVSKHD